MRTVEFPDEVLASAERAAAARGISVIEWVEQKAKEEAMPAVLLPNKGTRIQFPIFHSAAPGQLQITDEMIREVEQEDDLLRSGLNL